MTKEKQIINSFNRMAIDIISENAKRGKYEYDDYIIMVCKKGGMPLKQRVKEFYEKNPDKYKEHLKQRRIQYRKRKNDGLCVKCGKEATINNSGKQILFCKLHQKLNNEYQNNRKK